MDCGGVIHTLLERKLVVTAGRKNVVGKPILYKTTKEFLVQFGLKDLSELPTLKELGIDVSVEEWYGLFAPADTPVDVVARLNKVLNDALNDPDVARQFSAQGATASSGTPQGLEHLVTTDLAKWKQVAAAAHLSAN